MCNANGYILALGTRCHISEFPGRLKLLVVKGWRLIDVNTSACTSKVQPQ